MPRRVFTAGTGVDVEHSPNPSRNEPSSIRAERSREKRIRRKSFRRYSRSRRNVFIFCSLVVASAMLLGVVFLNTSSRQASYITAITPGTGSQLTPPNASGDLQSELSEFAAVYPGEYGVAVSDPATGESAYVNSDRVFDAASLAKLPALMTLYREAASGDIDLDQEITIQPGDVQPYGSGVLLNYPVGYEMSLRDCAEVLIKESDNTAWVMLERRLGKRRIASEIEALGAKDTDYYAYTSTPEDVLLMLRAISDPYYTNPELSREMLSFMTDTAYEDRLPASLPPNVGVAHKVGSWEDTFSDAGIISRTSFKENDCYIVVVSSGVNEKIARQAIRDTARIAYETL